MRDIWVLYEHRGDAMEEATLGLINEARRLLAHEGGDGRVTVVALGDGLEAGLEGLGAYGVDRVLYLEGQELSLYHGELFTLLLTGMILEHAPSCLLVCHGPDNSDLCARLGAMLETGVVTRAMDLSLEDDGSWSAVRAVNNGYLFERLRLQCAAPLIISLLPAVLTPPQADGERRARIVRLDFQPGDQELACQVLEVIEADPGDLDIAEAEIVVSGGRGVGQDDAFEVVHDLARAIGGSVAATRPVIDKNLLSYERQIGQTGKTVTPKLIINCGISGANEYTAGMEKSQLVIAVNTDPRARIFRFADLGVVGDLHQVLPLLTERLEQLREEEE
jgi:electron transfer flavoprotein alpha subunit